MSLENLSIVKDSELSSCAEAIKNKRCLSSATLLRWPFGFISELDNMNTRCSNGVSLIAGTCKALTDSRITEIGGIAGWQTGLNCFKPVKTVLTTISLSNLVTVNTNGFANLSYVTTLNLPKVKDAIGSFCFAGMKRLTNVTLPKLETGGPHLFRDGSAKTFNLPKLQTIEPGAFCGQYYVTNIYAPEAVLLPTDLSSSGYKGCQFYDCKNLNTITLNWTGIQAIPVNAFFGCFALSTSFVIPNASLIESSAFLRCSALKTITLGSECQLLNSNAFNGCTKLTSIYVPSSCYASYAVSENWSYFSAKLVSY